MSRSTAPKSFHAMGPEQVGRLKTEPRAGPCLKRRGRRAARVVLPQDRHQLGGAWQAPDVRRQNSHGPGLTFAGRDVSTFLI